MFLIFKFNLYLYVLSVLSMLLISCGGSSDDEIVVVEGPTNLMIEAIINGKDANNPNGDGSGEVVFNFLAANASLYKISFGDGESNETANTSLTHTYKASGVNSYLVYISAYKGSLFISTSISITVKVDSHLLWADEFDIDGPVSSSNWFAETVPPNNGSWWNNEEQHYTDRLDNAYVSDGTLKIVATKENYTFQNSTKSYTSARLNTKNKFEFTYGRVDVRAKLPSAAGTWPAIWMLGANYDAVGWPNCGEIDIMEQTGWDKTKVLGTCHWFNSAGSNNASYGLQTTVPNSTSEFHVYSMEWTPTHIKILVDDIEFYQLELNASLPFSADQFLILNIAMGGNLGGAIDQNFASSTMEIDYVRVYR